MFKTLKALAPLTLLAAFTASVPPAYADAPGAGKTARFEVEFMKLAIDHHFSALRITELAAGTKWQRDDSITPTEGVAPTPGFAATRAKATLDDLKSMARRNNRMQREEILTMQSHLRDWYGVQYQPQLTAEGRQMIAVLERAQPGADFNHSFYEVFSRHHYTLMEPVNACLTGADLTHDELKRECTQMWHSQIADIDMMRNELKKHFGIVDYQPFPGLKPLQDEPGSVRGHHSGSH